MLRNIFREKLSLKGLSQLFKDDFALHMADPDSAARGRAEQFDVIRANLGTITLGNIFAGFLTVLTFVGSYQFQTALFWFLGFLAIVSITMGRSARKLKAAKGKPRKYPNRAGDDVSQVQSAVTLGLVWAAMPLLLFGDAEHAQRLYIIATLLALVGVGSFFLSGVPRAAVSFSLVMIVGLVAAIFLNWHSNLLNPLILTLAFSLLIIGMIRKNATFLIERMEARIALVESNEMIGVLLREHEDSGYEWLWETGSDGTIRNVSKKFVRAAGVSAMELEGKPLPSVLQEPTNCPTTIQDKADCPSIIKGEPACKICHAMEHKMPFRDIVVKYLHPVDGVRWWKLSGRPFSDRDDVVGGYRGVALDITDVKKSEDKIAYLALYDSMTNLPNRASFREAIDKGIEKTMSGSSSVALFVLDLDKFKHINDTLGHPAGDELLIQVARRLDKKCVDSTIVARLGGDEFSILHDGISNCEEAEAYARNLIGCFYEPFTIAGRKMSINCSIGAAIAPVHGDCTGDLIKNADLALYRAKADNNCSYNIFEAEMDLQVRERRRLGQELQLAIANEELYLLYQPLLCTKTNAIIGYEALVRWENPRCGIVNPEYFIPIAEENGMIVEIGKWVIHQACIEAASWNNSRRISVNLSPLQFVGIQLESVVATALGNSGLLPSRLELEITENSLMVNKVATLQTLQNLRKLGISIALDDFGTGYSSLSYLMSYPFDKIKIDRSFLSKDDPMGNNATIIRTIIGLAKSLGMRTTAEGVETVEHLEFLKSEGCEEIQGFLISRPVLPAAIEKGDDVATLQKNLGIRKAVA